MYLGEYTLPLLDTSIPLLDANIPKNKLERTLVVYRYNTVRDHSHLYNLIPGSVNSGHGGEVLSIGCWLKNILHPLC